MKTRRSILSILSALTAGLILTTARAEQKEQLPGLAAKPASYFFTGKPYDADLGAYVFAYRSYNPECNRWTTPDPSGFPDGANAVRYAPCPTGQLDFEGCFTISNPAPNPSTLMSPDGKLKITVAKMTQLSSASDFSFNDWTFSSGEALDGSLNVSQYGAGGTDREGRPFPVINLAFSFSGYTGSMQAQLKWIQILHKTVNGVPAADFVPDNNANPFNPFYQRTPFYDNPNFAQGWKAGSKISVDTYAVIWDGKKSVVFREGIHWEGIIQKTAE